MFRATLVAALSWCVLVIVMCLVCVASGNGVLTSGTMALGPEHMSAVLVAAFASVGSVVIALINGWFSLLNSRSASELRRRVRNIDDAVNNRHHVGEDGEPMKAFDVLIQTHAEVRETKKLALENRESIIKLTDDMNARNCPFHEQNAATLAEIKKRLDMP